MPIFEYRGKDQEGKPVRGTLSASSVGAAAAELETKGLSVEHLGVAQLLGDPIPSDFGRPKEQSSTTEAPPQPRERSYVEAHVVGQLVLKPPLSELLFFFRQLSTMLSAGVGIVQSLDTLSNQVRDPRMGPILKNMRAIVLEGKPLSSGMEVYPEAFTPLMISLTRTGEEGGMLDGSLRLVADYIDQEIKLRNLYRRLTLYPKLVVAASIIIIMGANAIISMLKPGARGLTSPLTEPSTWVCLGPILIGLFVWFRLIVPNPAMRAKWDQFLSMLPYIGKTLNQFAMAKFGRALGALYRGGVPIAKATLLAAEASGNEFVRSRFIDTPKKLEQGYTLQQAFAETGVVSPIVLDMVATGESTGNLDLMMDKMADFYEDEAETRATTSAYIVGVLALLLVGMYVGYVVINFYAGHFNNIASGA